MVITDLLQLLTHSLHLEIQCFCLYVLDYVGAQLHVTSADQWAEADESPPDVSTLLMVLVFYFGLDLICFPDISYIVLKDHSPVQSFSLSTMDWGELCRERNFAQRVWFECAKATLQTVLLGGKMKHSGQHCAAALNQSSNVSTTQ